MPGVGVMKFVKQFVNNTIAGRVSVVVNGFSAIIGMITICCKHKFTFVRNFFI
jgi:hypothetical protein